MLFLDITKIAAFRALEIQLRKKIEIMGGLKKDDESEIYKKLKNKKKDEFNSINENIFNEYQIEIDNLRTELSVKNKINLKNNFLFRILKHNLKKDGNA